MCHWITSTASPSPCPWYVVIAERRAGREEVHDAVPGHLADDRREKAGCRTMIESGRAAPTA
jgi:hypothetical protein